MPNVEVPLSQDCKWQPIGVSVPFPSTSRTSTQRSDAACVKQRDAVEEQRFWNCCSERTDTLRPNLTKCRLSIVGFLQLKRNFCGRYWLELQTLPDPEK
ncbi:hypothetical protein UPYG_G00076730 [Umbra pygmaea]|uniref:Uncharacterized protein n=1 Tax=Umbra pygmaea TaxID=75934 RepID=A0ABD0XGC5_UMBPY